MAAPQGNQNARKQRYISDALRRKLAQDPERAARIAEKVLQDAEDGNYQAFKELLDRTEGKAPQPLTGGDDEDSPIRFLKIERVIVKATTQDG